MNFDMSKLNELHENIQEACNIKNQLQTEHINTLCDKISNLLAESAGKRLKLPQSEQSKMQSKLQEKRHGSVLSA